MSAFLALVLLAVQPTPAALKLAAPGLAVVGLDAQRGEHFSGELNAQLKRAGIDVVSPPALGVDRQQQLLACAEPGCLSELSAALGVDGVVQGELTKEGDRLAMSLRIIAGGKTVALFADSAGSEDAAGAVFARAADQLANQTATALHRPLKPDLKSGPSAAKLALIPLAGGVAIAGLGGLLFGLSKGHYQTLASGVPATAAEGRALQSTGRTEQTAGVVGFAVGGAALTVALGMLLYDVLPSMEGGTTTRDAIPIGGFRRDFP